MTGRILVVDDVQQNVRLLEAKLSSEYYTVLSCFSGVEALEKVKDFMPDVILLDVMMPEMDGFETCRRLKADPETAHIPVVMVTALSEQEDRVTGLEAGATDFITKPIDEVHLFARVKSLVRVKMMLDELRMRDKTGAQFGLTGNAAEESMRHVTGTILVIDDDRIQSRKVEEALQDHGHRIVIEEDPERAISLVGQQQFDLVVISTMLDEIDGIRLGMQILTQENNRNLPIMIIIDEHEKPLLAKALEVGVDDYVMTPVDANELKARAATQIRRKHYQDALKANYEASISAAVMDSLTKLYNRRYLDAHLTNIVEEAKQKHAELSLMTIDIDHFKAVNDHPGWGHHIGDEVLQQVADRIKHSVRSTDLATRPGGEEFVILMPGTGLETALMVAERTRQMMANTPFQISADPHQIQCTVSIGVSALLGPEDSAAALLKRSDEALYRAKDEGRNRVITIQGIPPRAG